MFAPLCTPHGDVLEKVVFERTLLQIRGRVVDGALLKTLHIMKMTMVKKKSIDTMDVSKLINSVALLYNLVPSRFEKSPLIDMDILDSQNVD
jgi:hypothetical protein